MKNKHAIHQLLSSWGEGQRQNPGRNEELKAGALSRLSAGPTHTPRAVRSLPWIPFAFTALAALTLVMGSGTKKSVNLSMPEAPSIAFESTGSSAGVAMDSSVSNQAYKQMAPEYYPYPQPTYPADVPITDIREFTKTDYHAAIRTREVQNLTRRVETTVRGFGGRVDSSNSSLRSGFVSFAVPANKFDSFRDEVESFAWAKLITTEVRTENLLPQKQSIEQQKEQNEKTLAELKADRQRTVSAHNRAVASIQTQLNSIAYALSLPQSPESRQALLLEQGRLQTQLANENASYSRKISYADSNIRQAEDNLTWTEKQDQTLLDNVATVRGTISLSWISIWEIMTLYVSPGWMFAILLAAAIASYFLPRRHMLL